MRPTDTTKPQNPAFDEPSAWGADAVADGAGALWWRLALAVAIAVVALAATASLLA